MWYIKGNYSPAEQKKRNRIKFLLSGGPVLMVTLIPALGGLIGAYGELFAEAATPPAEQATTQAEVAPSTWAPAAVLAKGSAVRQDTVMPASAQSPGAVVAKSKPTPPKSDAEQGAEDLKAAGASWRALVVVADRYRVRHPATAQAANESAERLLIADIEAAQSDYALQSLADEAQASNYQRAHVAARRALIARQVTAQQAKIEALKAADAEDSAMGYRADVLANRRAMRARDVAAQVAKLEALQTELKALAAPAK